MRALETTRDARFHARTSVGRVGQVLSPRVCKVLGQGSIDPTFTLGPEGLSDLSPELIPIPVPLRPICGRPLARALTIAWCPKSGPLGRPTDAQRAT